MFVYLSKKINIPHGLPVSSVAWNSAEGWISCGGASGLLKVLRLEDSDAAAAAASGKKRTLRVNQTLEGHQGSVVCATWNAQHGKLTTSDSYGLIVVWQLVKGVWFEEMINNRNKSVVTDMSWSADGDAIVICYADGATIVGGVNGERRWGKELDAELTNVSWSPSARSIMFGTAAGKLLLHDSSGGFIRECPVHAVPDGSGARIVRIQWYDGRNGYLEPAVPCLAVLFDNGRVQIGRNETDDRPVLIDTELAAVDARWNHDGTMLAIGGTQQQQQQGGDPVQVVQFFSPYGVHLHSLRMPGERLTSLSWEGRSLRMALGVDSSLYFASVRPDYRWGFFDRTLVYAFSRPEREECCVVFFDTESGERHVKYVRQLLKVRAAGDHCVFVTMDGDRQGHYICIVCNAIGSPVASRYISVRPDHVSMTSTHVVVASDADIYVWQYAAPGGDAVVNAAAAAAASSSSAAGGSGGARAAAVVAASSRLTREGRELVFHVDDRPDAAASSIGGAGAGAGVARGGRSGRGLGGGASSSSSAQPLAAAAALAGTRPTDDPVVAVAASESTMLVARASGMMLRYSLPGVVLEHKYGVYCRPRSLAINCTGKRVAVVDIHGALSLFDLDARPGGAQGPLGERLEFARKDTWDVMWSADNPELFATMEKSRMYVFRGTQPEEPVTSPGYLCRFSDLCIQAVLLDEVMADPERPDPDHVLTFETKSLRDTRELLATVPVPEALQFVEDNPHPRLWRLLAEAALEQLDFATADKAFVRCLDYPGIQFVKRLQLLQDRKKQRAEVAAYFKRFDEAENIYLEMGNKELAVELRTRLGDWFRVVQLIQSGGAGDDRLLAEAYNNIGDYYADRQKWGKAFKHYALAKNLRSMAECAYMLDNYTALRKIVAQVPDGSDFLLDVGEKFMSVGLCAEAVAAFEKLGNAKAAIDCCVVLNQWDQAVALAERHNFPQIEGLLTKYASHLLEKGQLFEAVELYRKAGRHAEAARLLGRLAGEAAASHRNPLRAKQLYVLAGLEADHQRKRLLNSAGKAGGGKTAAMQTLATMMEADTGAGTGAGTGASSLGPGENPWHGAEAYHFFMLAQRQVYGNDMEAAARTALRLRDYDDVLPPADVHSLVALATYHCGLFEQCSRAFSRLETADGVSEDQRERYRKLAMSVFVRHAPRDPKAARFRCPNRKCDGQVTKWDTSCGECSRALPACVATGRSIVSDDEAVPCRSCHHKVCKAEARRSENCPLCHVPM